MSDKKLATESPKVRPAWWAWLMAIACFAVALLANIAVAQYFLPFAVLGVGAGITVLQCSRLAKIPRKTRVTFCALVTVTTWIAFVSLLIYVGGQPAAAG